jgi:hypothetical protein
VPPAEHRRAEAFLKKQRAKKNGDDEPAGDKPQGDD